MTSRAARKAPSKEDIERWAKLAEIDTTKQRANRAKVREKLQPGRARTHRPFTRPIVLGLADRYGLFSLAEGPLAREVAVTDLQVRLNAAAHDHRAHDVISGKGVARKIERQQAARLLTLLNRARAAVPRLARVRETIRGLGFRGEIELRLHGWNGEPDSSTLGDAAERALMKRTAEKVITGRRRDADGWWIRALVLIFARSKGEKPVIGRDVTDNRATGPLAEFVIECSKTALPTILRVSASTLRTVAKEMFK